MNAPLRKLWTQEEFFAWKGHAEGRYEFDGFEPVAMTGGTFNHSRIMHLIYRALDRVLSDSPCLSAGPDAGIATVGNKVRYPDAMVTCAKVAGDALVVPGVVIVFEVVSAGSSRLDRIVKVREYAAVATILRYLIVESTTAGVTVLERKNGAEPWTASTLTVGEALRLPEVGAEIPVASLYEGIEFAGEQEA